MYLGEKDPGISTILPLPLLMLLIALIVLFSSLSFPMANSDTPDEGLCAWYIGCCYLSWRPRPLDVIESFTLAEFNALLV
jgi:hypothetical protein